MDCIKIAQDVFDVEISVLQKIRKQLGLPFEQMVKEIIGCQGKVIFIGMGKSGHVAKKIAASMASLGTCAIALHPGECMHGDLGMIQKQDVVIMISYSGESEEILHIIPGIKMIGASISGITGNAGSALARSCKIVQVMDDIMEACYLGLAPTSSTTAVMVYGDALAVTASYLKGFGREDFGKFHPAGSLGKQLITRAVDLMHPIQPSSFVKADAALYDVLQSMIETDTDLIMVVNDAQELIGIITNGELKRNMAGNTDIMVEKAEKLIHRYPYFIDDSAMAIDALKFMAENHVHAVPVVRNNVPVGVIEKRDIIKYGIQV